MIMKVHQGQPVLKWGGEYRDAKRIVILLHGRGAKAESMLSIAEALEMDGNGFVIPQAAGNRWYPQTAFGPLEVNEPDLSSALQVIGDLVEETFQFGFEKKQVFLGGFSQGACLAGEYVARNPARYGGLFMLSGALIGPPDQIRTPEGDLGGTPVFLGSSDQDPWISHSLVNNAARVFNDLGGQVDFQTYPGLGHSINLDEIQRVREMLGKSE
jgi:predicted esterase